MTSYLFSLLTVTTHALHLMSLWSNHHHQSKSLIEPSDMLHLIFGTSFLHHSEFLIRIIHPPLSNLHLNMPVWFAAHCYHLPSLFHCFTLSSKPTFSENLIVCFCLSDWSHGSWPFTGFICSSVLCFSSIFYVLVISTCGRLSWPALWSTFGRTIIEFVWLKWLLSPINVEQTHIPHFSAMKANCTLHSTYT